MAFEKIGENIPPEKKEEELHTINDVVITEDEYEKLKKKQEEDPNHWREQE